ncbi:MAG: ATP-dependent DNA ligase [Polyangiaceae bacterium]|nr:ATP-dependent DNA ligase [Polyangiaceae bacterium]
MPAKQPRKTTRTTSKKGAGASAKRTKRAPVPRRAKATAPKRVARSKTKRSDSQKLATYWKKRDFEVTPEPKGGPTLERGGFGYLIQKHDARRLHYDFRLELDGVLLSWAVPKGPSLAPEERRLAVRTEDHPIEYGDFEGVIPEGQYGGGTVMLWDRGTWKPEGDPHEAIDKGHLAFSLEGERLRGRFHLVRTRRKPGDKSESWLLFKGKDAAAATAKSKKEPIETEKTSVVTGRSMEEIASDRKRTWQSSRVETTPAERTQLRDLVSQIPTTVSFTNLDKILYAEQGLSKAGLIAYYAIVEPYMMPYLKDRPVTLVRCPDGAPSKGEVHQKPKSTLCFYQKHAKTHAPDAIIRVPIEEEGGTKDDYMAISNRDGLLAAVQLGSLELHTWGCHIDDVERPDTVVMDLDPDPDLPWKAVAEAAFEMRALLEELGLDSWVKTTGGKGLHVCFPVTRRLDWEAFKGFTKAVATTLEGARPNRYTTNPIKARRKGKVFIDYLRNGRGATAIAPYSTRARPNATIATPIGWDELKDGIRPEELTLRSMPARLDALKKDPWARFLETKQSITAAMRKRLGL